MLNIIIGGAFIALAGVPVALWLLKLAQKRQAESLQKVRVVADQRRRYHN